MEATTNAVNAKLALSEDVGLDELKVFRMLRWLLTSQEDARIQKLVSEARLKRQRLMSGRMIMDGEMGPMTSEGRAAVVNEDDQEKPDDAAPTSVPLGRPSSASSHAAEPPSTEPPAPKTPTTKPELSLDAGMSLFFPKAKKPAK